MGGNPDDVKAIKSIIARQFVSLCWTRDTTADWAAFSADFLPNATLFPAGRPVTSQTVAAFVERMKSLSKTTLPSFQESVLGSNIHVFGNIAVAIAGVEITEDDAKMSCSVEMMLLVKSEGAWRIASQAWDKAGPSDPMPAAILAGGGSA